jgi:predicted GNAT family acetyltransferase
MAGRARPTRSTITVNAVYTPPELRRQGFATAAVAALSRALLAEGYPSCVLYTDLANPTSNSIYRRIGYEPVADAVRWFFR